MSKLKRKTIDLGTRIHENGFSKIAIYRPKFGTRMELGNDADFVAERKIVA